MRAKLLLSLVVALCVVGNTNAHIIFVGIGNDEFRNDVTVSSNTIQNCLTPGDTVTLAMQQDKPGITNLLTNAKNMAMAGDIAIIHYAGHGGKRNDGEGQYGTSPDMGVTFPNPITDDEVAAIINMFPASVAVLSIFDTCFAGELDDGDVNDIQRGLVIGTADANHCAPGQSIFLPFWNMAFASNGMGSLNADANNDGMVTLGELFNYLSRIVGTDPSNPFASNHETAQHLDYVVWAPEPSGLIMLGIGGLLIVLWSRQRKLEEKGVGSSDRGSIGPNKALQI
jgi:hypothetical protein